MHCASKAWRGCRRYSAAALGITRGTSCEWNPACCCVLGAHRPRRHSGAASSSCQDAVSLSRSDASAVGRGRSPPSSERGVRWSGLLRRCAESTLGRHLRAQQIAGFYLPRVAHCPGLRCCSPHSPAQMVLVLNDCRAHALKLAAAVLSACVLVPTRSTCSGRCPTWTTPWATFHNCRTQARALVLVRPLWLGVLLWRG